MDWDFQQMNYFAMTFGPMVMTAFMYALNGKYISIPDTHNRDHNYVPY